MEHLLHALPLRLTVWLVAGFTLGANVLVMSGRAALSDDNRVLSLVIRSLAGEHRAASAPTPSPISPKYENVNFERWLPPLAAAAADLLMGVYLLVIASADEVMRGKYNSWAHSWMTSWVCTLAGVLSMLSSEVGVALRRCTLVASSCPEAMASWLCPRRSPS